MPTNKQPRDRDRKEQVEQMAPVFIREAGVVGLSETIERFEYVLQHYQIIELVKIYDEAMKEAERNA